jgi:polyhydroxybutyrate depolymerase
MVLHGGGESAAEVASPVRVASHWKSIADQDKFIVVYPDGVDNQWHDCRSDGHTRIGRADDVGFLGALISQIHELHGVDLTRVYSTGTSNGGMMSFRLAAELPERIAAIGPNVANQPADPDAECRGPTQPVTVATINSDADPLVPWNGGCLLLCTSGSVIGAEATRDYWINHNQAQSVPAYSYSYPNIYANDGPSTVTQYRYDGGANGPQVAFFRVFGGGHNEPSLHHYQGSGLVGPQNRDMEMTAELWAIMKNHARPGVTAMGERSLFNDGFESGDFTAGGWTASGSPAVMASAGYEGAFGARVNQTSSLTRERSTLGYPTVRVRFAWRTSGLSAGEHLYAEWSTDGVKWSIIKQTQEASWAKETFTLPPSAANNAGFRLRFRTNAASPSAYADVDEVMILVSAVLDECGADPVDALSRPERVDGALAGVDDDGDTVVDEALPAAASGLDCDGDGYTGAAETHLYSYVGQANGDQKLCQEYDVSHPNPNADTTPSLRWPSDVNRSAGPPDSFNRVNIFDLTTLLAPVRYFDTDVGTNPGDVRFDLAPGPGLFLTDINITDLTALLAGPSGMPPMLAGVRAFDGPVCPYGA